MASPDHDYWMRCAIAAAREGIEKGQSPFGCAVVRGTELVGLGHNEVVGTPDPTAHAEIVALRRAALKLGTHDLSGCRCYATCEPCPMCASAIHWAKIREVFFGASIEDARRAGFSEIDLTPEQIYHRTEEDFVVRSAVLRSDCVQLFEEWLARPDRVVY